MVRERNPMEICVFAVLAASTAGTVFHLSPLPPSLAESATFGRFAATTLFAGCVVAIAGLLWRDRRDGLVIEQFGCALAGFGCLFYGAALLRSTTFPPAALAVGMSFGIGVFCLFRYWQVDRYVRACRLARLARGRPEDDG